MYATDTLVNERELVLRLIDGDEEGSPAISWG